jgi:hypothetical protein
MTMKLIAPLIAVLAGCVGPRQATPPATPPALGAGAPVVPEPAAVPAADDWRLLLLDSFDGVEARGPGLGLNDGLGQRQSGALAPSTYSIRPGDWVEGTQPMPGTCRVGAPGVGAGRLTIHGVEGRPYGAAVQLDRPLPLEGDGGLRISLRVDPAVGDEQSLGWASVMLIPVDGALGWVTRPENLLGVYVRSNGELQVHSGGREADERFAGERPGPAASYTLELWLHLVREGQRSTLRLEGALQGIPFTATLDEGPDVALPPSVFLALGTHFHLEQCASRVSWFDNLRIASPAPHGTD